MASDQKADRLRDVSLERTVLGQVLEFSLFDSFRAAGLDAGDFSWPANRAIWQACQSVADAGNQANYLLVRSYLKLSGQMDEVGEGYLVKLLEGVPCPPAATILSLVARLQQLASRRLARKAGRELEASLDAEPERADELIARHLASLQAAQRHGGRLATLDAQGQIAALHAERVRAKAHKLYLGIPTIDGLMGGIRPGEVCGVMARPGVGKTLVLCHQACAFAEVENGAHVLFSLEMPAAQIVERLARMALGLGRYDLEDSLDAGEFEADRYQRAFGNLWLIDTPGLSVQDMDAALTRMVHGPLAAGGQNLRLVTIDHLGLVGGDRRLSTYDRLSVQSREIKELAKRHDCAVTLAIQVNRETGGDGSRELHLGSARDSGVIEEAMDYLVALRRLDRATHLAEHDREKYKRAIFLRLVKNRHGELGDECGVRLAERTLQLQEEPGLKPEREDVARLAEMAGRRR